MIVQQIKSTYILEFCLNESISQKSHDYVNVPMCYSLLSATKYISHN